MDFIKKTVNLFKGLHWYLLLALSGVVVIYGINLVGVEIFKLNAQFTYFISTAINIIISFLGNSKIFGRGINRVNLLKFSITTAIFFFSMNYLFHIFVVNFNLNYLIAITINFFIFPLLKFLSYKYLVFTEKYGQPNF